MKTSLKVIVDNVHVKAELTGVLTSGMVGVPVTFQFDESWEELNKIAVFENVDDHIFKDRDLNLGDEIKIPWEVLQRPGTSVRVGVEGRNADGTVVIPTRWAGVGIVLSGAQASGDPAMEPTPSVFDQIMQAIDDGRLQGEQGPQGEQGLAGPQGEPGKDGAELGITGASVGQIAQITAVDENGAPTKWSPVDMPSGGGSVGGGVGKLTKDGGEIFNDYENNQAISNNTHAEGQETLSGIKGYPIASTDTASLTITLNDAELEEKASAVYTVGDTLQFDSTSGHYYDRLEITEISSNEDKTVITVKDLIPTASKINLDLNPEKPEENYVWVVGKNYGEVFPMAYGSHAEGELAKAMGRAAHAEGRDTQAIGNYAHAEGRGTTANYAAHAEGLNTSASGGQSHAEGNKTKAIGSNSHAEGQETIAIGDRSHAEGYKTQANFMAHAEGQETQAIGQASHAEGFKTSTEGDYSHAEGRETKALSAHSHAEGFKTTAGGADSHAEGSGTETSGAASHAEGNNTKANGAYSHAEGEGTIARAIGSHVQGRFNKEDTGLKYAHIIGGGTSDTDRKNIHTVDWEGNAWYSGSLCIGNTEVTEEKLKALLALLG